MKDSTKFLLMISILLLIGINCRGEKPIIKVKSESTRVSNGLYEVSDSIDILQTIADDQGSEIKALKTKVDSLNSVAIAFRDMALKSGGLETHWYDGILTPKAGSIVNVILYWSAWIIGAPLTLVVLFFSWLGLKMLVGLSH